MQALNPDFVTIIRNKDGEYVREDIIASSVLPDSRFTAGEIYMSTVNRLRKDKSVFLVLEEKMGKCDEEAQHPNGIHFRVHIDDEDTLKASLILEYKNDVIFDTEFIQEEDDEDYVAPNIVSELIDTIIELLHSIDAEDYSFVDDDCLYFKKPKEYHNPIQLFEAKKILEGEGFQTEEIVTMEMMARPLLFIYENEVVLLGSERFSGESLFVEIKRYYLAMDPQIIEDRINTVRKNFRCVNVIHWDDDSWSFRVSMDEDVYSANFLDKLHNDIIELMKVISVVEEDKELQTWCGLSVNMYRHFFIYETIDDCVKYSKIDI